MSNSLTLVGLLILGMSVSKGDLILSLAFPDGSTSKEIASGSAFEIDLFLSETNGGTLLMTDGLGEGGGRITQTGGAALVHTNGFPSLGSNPTGSWSGPSLVSPVPSIPPGSLSSAYASTVPFGEVGIGGSSVHLFRFGFIVTGDPGDMGILTPGILDSSVYRNVSGLPEDLDSILMSSGTFEPATITVGTAVPEPSAVLMASAFVVIFQGFSRRRPDSFRRRKSKGASC
jgi:hypothetical protein